MKRIEIRKIKRGSRALTENLSGGQGDYEKGSKTLLATNLRIKKKGINGKIRHQTRIRKQRVGVAPLLRTCVRYG